MPVLSLQEAGEQAGSKVDIWLAIQEGMLSAQRADEGGSAIDPAELFRVFEWQQPEQRHAGQDATASPARRGRPRPARRPPRSPDRRASIGRRRRQAASGALPPALAAQFTQGGRFGRRRSPVSAASGLRPMRRSDRRARGRLWPSRSENPASSQAVGLVHIRERRILGQISLPTS